MSVSASLTRGNLQTANGKKSYILRNFSAGSAGGWVIFRGVRKKKGEESTIILPPPRKFAVPSPPRTTIIRRPSPKSQLDLDAESIFQGGSTVTGSTKKSQQTFSPFTSTGGPESLTSLNTGDHQEEAQSQDDDTESTSDILSALSPFTQPARLPPQCIHEVPSPSLLFSLDFPASTCRTTRKDDCGTSLYRTNPIEHDYIGDRSHSSVRYDGFIEPVDEDLELTSFESARSMSFAGNDAKEKNSMKIETVKQQYIRTLQLLNERARLLTQLSDLKNSHG